MAFNQKIGKTSVTLEGDIFQPSGLVTGGSRKYDAILFLLLQLTLECAYISYFLSNRLLAERREYWEKFEGYYHILYFTLWGSVLY